MDLRKGLNLGLATLLLAALLGCSVLNTTSVTGSGRAETRDFAFVNFTSVQATNAFNVQINRSTSHRVQVTADDNLWESLDISEKGTTLRLGAKSGVVLNSATLQAIIALPDLSSVNLSGASRVTVAGFNSDNALTFILSGASNANINDMRSGATTFDISGAGTISGNIIITSGKFLLSGGSRVTLNGSGNTASIDGSGGSRTTLDQFKTQSTSVSLSGGSEARVNTQNITSADLSGGSNLYYVDTPTIGKINSSGGSNVRPE